jgi:putative nucleotidyltransferase with HDIG domain
MQQSNVAKHQRSILIADPDENFLATLLEDPKAAHHPPLIAKNGREAQLKLADKTQSISGLFVNPRILSPDVLSVIRCCHIHRPVTPIFIIHDGTSPFSEEQLKSLPIQELLKKPITLSELHSKVGPITFIFDPLKANPQEENLSQADAINSEVRVHDTAFISIRAEDFLAGSKSFFDVYVRLSSGRFLKILQAGDVFAPERVAAYLRKGVTLFFLRKEEQERYLSYCDQLAGALISKKEVPVEIKMTQTLNQGVETIHFLKNNGLSEAHLQYARNFINHTHTLVTQLSPVENDLLKGFMSDIAGYEHGVSTSMLAAMMIKPLQITGERPVQIVGLACLLHDIGLYQMDPELRDEVEEKMTPAQLVVFKTHPIVGADLLKSIRSMDPAIAQAIAQHHERRDRKGFPAGIGLGAINRVAEIVGICDEFAKLIKLAVENPEIYVLQRMEKTVFPGFSEPVIKAFRMAFFMKSSS